MQLLLQSITPPRQLLLVFLGHLLNPPLEQGILLQKLREFALELRQLPLCQPTLIQFLPQHVIQPFNFHAHLGNSVFKLD
jgi:hypothetical protein